MTQHEITPQRLLPDEADLSRQLGSRTHVQLFWLLRAVPERDTAEVLANVLAAGARLVWGGRTESLLIGPDPVHWTHAALVEISTASLRALAASGADADGAAAALWIVDPQPIPAPLQALFRCLRPLGRVLERDPLEAVQHRPAEMDENDINPSQARLEKLAADRRDGRTTMINLLRYRDRADYGPSGPSRSGRAAYRRYGVVAARSVAMVGGSMPHLGRLRAPLLDVPDLATTGPWHDLAIVHYPAPSSIVKLEAMPGYAKAVRHRTAGLARTAIVVAR